MTVDQIWHSVLYNKAETPKIVVGKHASVNKDFDQLKNS